MVVGHYKPCKEHQSYIGTIETMRGCFFCIEQENKRLSKKLAEIRVLVDKQADDSGLWFDNKYITEDYLQCALRDLHHVIEEEK
jgi:hypothetical protein